jgi:hypothetical protein
MVRLLVKKTMFNTKAYGFLKKLYVLFFLQKTIKLLK